MPDPRFTPYDVIADQNGGSLETNKDVPKNISPEVEQRAKREESAIRLLEGLGFSVVRRSNDEASKSFSDQSYSLGREQNIREVTFEPAAYDKSGKLIATQEVNGHQVVVAFSLRGTKDFDAGIFLDGKYIGANNDFNRGELLANVRNAMAVATFEKDLGNLPTWTDDYKRFEDDFRAKVDETKVA